MIIDDDDDDDEHSCANCARVTNIVQLLFIY